jgi:feruloyl esterase
MRLGTFRWLIAILSAGPMLAASCESLRSLSLPHAMVTFSQAVGAGAFTAPETGGRGRGPGDSFKDLPAFCRVAMTLTPSADSDIKVEVWLPAAQWNGKFLAAGSGGGASAALQGSINFPGLAGALRRGFATAATDTGHAGATLSYAIDHPERLIDFGYRAVHEMTVDAKAVIAAYYGDAPKVSYWNGCAAAGRQGMMEVQRFPADYDGVVVSAAANNWSRLQTWSLSMYEATHKDEARYIPSAKYALIHKAALEQCDAMDGVKDGLIENPKRCRFDPAALACKGTETSGCLTAAQIQAARQIYSDLVNPRTKSQIFPGLEPGSELGWGALADGPEPSLYVRETFKYLVFKDPQWDYRTRPVDYDADATRAEQLDHGVVSATNADLRPFFARGGKMILYHGWTDPLISPEDAVNYYKRVQDTVGAANLRRSMRLYMVPGMNHCRGGEGPDDFDMQPVMEQWLEKQTAPESVIASKINNGKVERTRPLCPYPQVAVWKGAGSIDDAANFVCK